MELLKEPDKRLRIISSPVKEVNSEIQSQLKSMYNFMLLHNGIGLAAPQVNMPKRMIVISLEGLKSKDMSYPLYMINPEVIWQSKKTRECEEGCLSVEETFVSIFRPREIVCKYLDFEGKVKEIRAKGLLATVIQHEIDHLNGILIIDRIRIVSDHVIL